MTLLMSAASESAEVTDLFKIHSPYRESWKCKKCVIYVRTDKRKGHFSPF
jgi:hypothetical protein